MAQCIFEIFHSPFDHLAPTFALVGPKEERKRPLGQAVQWKPHRQAASALKAVASGYQLKRGALKPLLDVETEPGEAIAWAVQIPHPFSQDAPLDHDTLRAIDQVTSNPSAVVLSRQELLRFWQVEAVRCLHVSDQLLRALADAPLRRLLRGVPDDQPSLPSSGRPATLSSIESSWRLQVRQTLRSQTCCWEGFPSSARSLDQADGLCSIDLKRLFQLGNFPVGPGRWGGRSLNEFKVFQWLTTCPRSGVQQWRTFKKGPA